MQTNFLSWQQAYEVGVAHCGGKGWNLARLHRCGFSIPAGGVLSSHIYHQLMTDPVIPPLIQHLRSIPDARLLTAESDTAQRLDEIRQAIFAMGLPVQFTQQLRLFIEQQALRNIPLAVRSSATLEDGESASFAGMHESYLNVNGLPAIEKAVLNCFASLWTPRAVTYRRKMGIDDQALGCAIVIMALVDAQAAGVAFSCDPATGREDISVINANFGLGESVVSGAIEPDEYKLNNHCITLYSRKVGNKTKYTLPNTNGGIRLADSTNLQRGQVLTEAQITLLGRLVQRVFWALGGGEQHQDIEWAFDGQAFFLLQARPVTAMPRLTCDALRNQTDIWSNGNFRDAAPLVQCTLGVSLFSHQVDVILRAPFARIGYSLPDGLRFVKSFQGRSYCNSSLMQWLYFDSIGFLPAATNRSMGGHQHEIEIDVKARGGLGKKLRRGWSTVKYIREMRRHKKLASTRTAKEIAFANTFIHTDLTVLSDETLTNKLQQCEQQIEAYALPFIMLTSLSGTVTMLFDLLEKYLPGKGTATTNALLAGAGDITSANHGYHLQELAALVEHDSAAQHFFNASPFVPNTWQDLPESSSFRQAFQQFIDEYGHRAVYEVYLNNPRWRENPDYLLNVIKQSIGGPSLSVLKAQQKNKAEQARQTVKEQIPFFLRALVKSLVKQAATGAASKEMAKSTYIRLFEPLRRLFLEVGQRFESRGLLHRSNHIFHCAYIEVISILNGDWNGNGLKWLIESRRAKKTELEKLVPPDLIFGDQPHYSKPVITGPGNKLTGMGVAAGRAEGPARLVHTPEQGVILTAGDVLVAPSTDPAWTPLFLNAAAIVMETGGQLSHGAIVAREYGIPAVVNIPGLFNMISDGERVTIDGDSGVVEKHPLRA